MAGVAPCPVRLERSYSLPTYFRRLARDDKRKPTVLVCLRFLAFACLIF